MSDLSESVVSPSQEKGIELPPAPSSCDSSPSRNSGFSVTAADGAPAMGSSASSKNPSLEVETSSPGPEVGPPQNEASWLLGSPGKSPQSKNGGIEMKTFAQENSANGNPAQANNGGGVPDPQRASLSQKERFRRWINKYKKKIIIAVVVAFVVAVVAAAAVVANYIAVPSTESKAVCPIPANGTEGFLKFLGDLDECNQPHGIGTLLRSSGPNCTGNYTSGKLNGQATCLFPHPFEGAVNTSSTWEDGKLVHVNKWSFESGIEVKCTNRRPIIEGECDINYQDARGNFQWYTGKMSDFRRHGFGELTLQNGDVYKGEFDRDLFQGIGNVTFHDESKLEANWDRGTLVSGRMTDSDGKVTAVKLDYFCDKERPDGALCQFLKMVDMSNKKFHFGKD